MKYASLPNGTSIKMQAVPITLEDSMGNTDTFDFIDIKNNLENKQAATILAKAKSQLWDKARGLRGEAAGDLQR